MGKVTSELARHDVFEQCARAATAQFIASTIVIMKVMTSVSEVMLGNHTWVSTILVRSQCHLGRVCFCGPETGNSHQIFCLQLTNCDRHLSHCGGCAEAIGARTYTVLWTNALKVATNCKQFAPPRTCTIILHSPPNLIYLRYSLNPCHRAKD